MSQHNKYNQHNKLPNISDTLCESGGKTEQGFLACPHK